jgi:hypothetical protein
MWRLAVGLLLVMPFACWADHFDYYSNSALSKAISEGAAKEFKELTSDQLNDFTSILSDSSSAILIVVTNDKRNAKLLVQPARQKIGKDKTVAMLLVDKYTTFKGTTDLAVQATGHNLHLYPGLRLGLEVGQVVPDALEGDLILVGSEKDPNTFIIKPNKEAKLYVLTKPLAGVVPKKAPKLVVGEAFDMRFFAGKYKLQDDGRRSGILKIEVNESGEISGTFTSDKDGREYDVQGKVGFPKHAVSFSIKFPATSQTFTGHLFTGNGKVIAGTSKMQDREAAFIAERIEE